MKSKTTKHAWTFLLLVLCGTAAKAQVSGIVSDAGSKETLPGATVHLKGTQTGTITDSNGYYQIPVSANDTLVVSFIGFQTHRFHYQSYDGRL